MAAMENNVLNSLQLYRGKWSADLADQSMLSNMLLTEPHKVSPVISYIFGRFDQGSVLDYITNGLGRTMTIESPNYEWDVMIEHDKAVLIKSATYNNAAITTTMVPGIAQSTIKLWLGEKWFGPGAILEFDNKDFQARVVSEPYVDGNDFVYTVVCADGKDESYIPPSLLAAGCKVSRLASAYEEYSEQADIFNYQSPFKLRNQLTTIRASFDITGSAFASVMVISLRDPKTKQETKYWAPYQEWTAWRQWYERIDRMGLYSRYNALSDGTINLKGANGRPVPIGAGILEQISPANRRAYTTLTLDTIDTFLSDLSYNLKGFGDRNFIAVSGEMGLREFDRVLRAKASGYTLVDTHFVSGSGQELTLGGQFVTYKGLNGITLTMKHLPLYDNPVFNRQLHPVSGKPLESYRITILDIGMRDGEPNLRKVVRKGREMVVWHTAGAVSPQGFANGVNTLRSNAKDGYSVHFLTEQGYMLADPTTSGELICDAA
jgi:hypothetical protein